MAILINKESKILIQGITGKQGRIAAEEMLRYSTKLLCGVTPGKGGQEVHGVPVYDSVREALDNHPDVDASLVYVPPFAAKGAVFEAIENGIKLIIIITENVPIHDTAKMIEYAKEKGARIIGPSSIGIMCPGKAKIGCMGGEKNIPFQEGSIGVISKSGGMSSETSLILKKVGLGQSTVIGIGGDVLMGTTFVDLLKMFQDDPETEGVVIFGEIGGAYEEQAAEFIKKGGFTKPIAAFISGKFASRIQDVTLGHAGAIIEGGRGNRDSKIKALKDAGVLIAEVHHELAPIIKEAVENERKSKKMADSHCKLD